ncbi:hypothetical protein [Enterococcus sp. DIV0174]|uniref:hypothetical protein n=1 Tax=Enterococcus sp. DIV0174 TaxID=2774785 RepID=UPI003D2FC847
MRYKNTKTGAVIDSSFVISGDDWARVEKPKEQIKQEIHQVIDEEHQQEQQEEQQEKQQEKQQEGIESKTGDENFDSITVPQIKQELDAFGIEYNPRAKKQELYDLMMAQGE